MENGKTCHSSQLPPLPCEANNYFSLIIWIKEVADVRVISCSASSTSRLAFEVLHNELICCPPQILRPLPIYVLVSIKSGSAVIRHTTRFLLIFSSLTVITNMLQLKLGTNIMTLRLMNFHIEVKLNAWVECIIYFIDDIYRGSPT